MSQRLVGYGVSQVPTNGMLGGMAYQDPINVTVNNISVDSGTLTVSAGTTALPSISPTGDSNTGIFFPAADTIAFSEGGSEVMRIKSDGSVGIGTINPSAKLDVEDNSSSGYIAEFRQKNTSNSAQIIIDSPSNGESRPVLIDMSRAGVLQWSIGQAYLDTNQSFHISTSTLQSGNTGSKLSITPSGNVNIGNGNLVIGTSGKGIDFSATANSSGTMTSELLDDYEEGTWTAALVGTTAVSYYNQGGKYVKIGKMVHVQALLQTASQTFSNTASSLQISGLPFLPNDNTGYMGTHGSVSAQQLHFNAAANTQGTDGDYISTSIVSNNIGFQITAKGTTRGEIKNFGFGTSGTGGCVVEFELTYYTTS